MALAPGISLRGVIRCLQNDVIPIINTIDQKRMRENLEELKFAITEKIWSLSITWDFLEDPDSIP